MEGTLKFNLPEESNEFKLAVHATDYYLALWDVSQKIRETLKYCDLKDDEAKAYETMQEFLVRTMENYSISFDM